MSCSAACVSLRGTAGRLGSVEVFSSCFVENGLSEVDWASSLSLLLMSVDPRFSGPGDIERGQYNLWCSVSLPQMQMSRVGLVVEH